MGLGHEQMIAMEAANRPDRDPGRGQGRANPREEPDQLPAHGGFEPDPAQVLLPLGPWMPLEHLPRPIGGEQQRARPSFDDELGRWPQSVKVFGNGKLGEAEQSETLRLHGETHPPQGGVEVPRDVHPAQDSAPGRPHRYPLRVTTPLLRASSRFVGWAADRRVPRFLRGPLYRGFARLYGADLNEARGPLDIYPSFSAFFVRRLVEGARPVASGPGDLPSPVDGTVQTVGTIEQGQVLQAKGRSYGVEELLGGVGAGIDLEGGSAWTLYLGPKDYHRIHAPEDCRVSEARWIGGARYSVDPKVLLRRQVLNVNERCVLRLETGRGPLLLVLVGALNVGRIRVVGLAPSENIARPDLPFGRGAELARFELGSTIVLLAPPDGPRPAEALRVGDPVRLGERIGGWSPEQER